MSDAVLIALITAVAGLLTAILVELIRARKNTAKVVNEVTPNGGASIKDAIGRIETDIREMRSEQSRHGARLAAVEAQLSMHLRLRPAREES